MQVVARPLLLAAVVAVTVGGASAAAQSAPQASDVDAVCLGFAFGAWSPPLDWRAAGHGDRPDSTQLVRAPAGRDWAAEAASPRDTALMLYPAWWPVGVVVEIPARRMVEGDTVTGRASALVADGRMRPPTANVRAWRVPCGGARADTRRDRSGADAAGAPAHADTAAPRSVAPSAKPPHESPVARSARSSPRPSAGDGGHAAPRARRMAAQPLG